MEKNYDTNVAVKKESNKVVNVVVVVLVVLLVSLSCYIVYSKFILDTSNSNENQNNSLEEKPKDPVEVPDEPEGIPVSKELAFELYNMLYDYDNFGYHTLEYYYKDKITADDLSNDEKTRIIWQLLKNDLDNKVEMNQARFTEKQIIDVKNRVLGKDTSFEIVDNRRCKSFYKVSDEEYATLDGCGGDMLLPLFLGDIIEAVQVKNMLYIDQRVVFVKIPIEFIDNSKYPLEVYENPEQTNFLGETTVKEGKNIITIREDNINGVIDTSVFAEQARVYRFTFRQNGDYYSFVQIERIK